MGGVLLQALKRDGSNDTDRKGAGGGKKHVGKSRARDFACFPRATATSSKKQNERNRSE